MAGTQIRSHEEDMGLASRRSVTFYNILEYRSSLLIPNLEELSTAKRNRIQNSVFPPL